MAGQLILHIGANKTGSSSIQRFLQLNKSRLNELNYIIPDASLGLTDKVTGEHVFTLQEFINSSGRPSTRLKTIIEKLFSQNPESNIILSAENLGTVQGAKLFKEACAARETKIIFYIRRQDELISSSWQQWNSKISSDFNAYLVQAIRTMGHWETILNHWGKVVDKDNISVGVFERNRFNGGDICYDFIEKIDAEEHVDSFKIPQHQSNLSYFEYITPLVSNNKDVFKGIHDNDFYKAINQLTGTRFSKGKKYSLMTAAQREAIMKYYENQNERLRASYFPESKTLFAPIDHSKYTYLSEGNMQDLQLRFLTNMVFAIAKKVI